MKSKKPEQKKSSELHKRAEEKLKSKTTTPETKSDKETRQLMHELQAHQIELEMQNEELRQAQAELEESRAKYSDLYNLCIRQEALLAAIPDIVMEVDNNNVYTWANQAGKEFFGEDIIGREASYYFQGEHNTCNIVRPLFNGSENVIYLESWQRRRDGQRRLLAWWCRGIKDKSGNVTGALSSARDITDIKQVEYALRKSEEKLRSFVESSSEHIFIIGDDGKYIHSNGRREFKLARGGSIIGLNISDIYPQKIAEIYREQIGHVFLTGEKLDFEYHIVDPDGIHYYVDTLFPIKHDKIIYAVGGIGRDITDIRKIANENEALSIISQLFLMRKSLADIYLELPGILSQKLKFPIVIIESYDIGASEMVIAGSVGLHGLEKTRLRVPVKQAISGKVVLTGKPIYDLKIKELSEYRGSLFSELDIETFICVPIVIKNKVFGTLSVADVRRRKRTQSYVNTLQVIANHLSQELDRLEALEAVSRAKDEWEHTFDAVPDLICILDKKFRIVRINLSMAEKLGMQPAACIGKTCYDIIHGAGTPPAFCPHAASLKNGSEHMVEIYEERLGGYFNISTSPIYDKQGQPIGSVHMARDITERKRVEDQIKSSLHEKEILLREIHHRVKNNMQIISSLMKLSSESIQDRSILDIFDDSRNRIKSMALIHEKLYQSTDLTRIEFSEYIESLAHELYRAHGVDPGRLMLKLSMEPILLSIDIAIPCGLIVNELITNSIKHAFPGETEGEISISLSEEENGVIEFTINDNGIGIPSSIDLSTAKTLGLYIVNILVEDQLEGSITLDRTKGTTFRITFSKKAEKKK